jgi:guanylate kinase
MSKLFVISAPSGAGKTSLVRRLLELRPNLVVSVSHTTRTPRTQEVEGQDYYFVTAARFHELAHQNAFLEHAQVFGNFYATGARQVEEKLASGKDVLLEIDWQGARQVRKTMPASISIFILPPSRLALEQRLRERQTDSAQTIARRLSEAAADMSHYKEFDYVVVNDHFEQAVQELLAILEGGGQELRSQRPQLDQLMPRLLH